MAIKVAVNRALTAITALPTAAALTDGNLTLLTTATASSSATLDFTSNIDSTYDSYLFKFIDIHPATDDVILAFQADTGTNTNYNLTVTSTFFSARHGENGSGESVSYTTNRDQAQGTGDIKLNYDVGNGNDESVSGELYLFAPSSSVFIKHFMARTSNYGQDNAAGDSYKAGYFNTTTAITRVRFKMTSGNIDSGTIKMYGVGDKQS
jgi:hypothetical protein